MYSFQLDVPDEFSFDQCLHFLKRSPRELLHRVAQASVTKLVTIDGAQILFKIEGKQNKLDVQILFGEEVAEVQKKITAYIIEWFDLDKDLKPFYALAAKDAILKTLVTRFYGYRIVGQPDLYESLVWAIIGQQINLQFAYTLKQKFVQQYGGKLVYDGETYYLFPEPKVIAQLPMEELLKLQFSRQKSKYAIGISEAFEKQELSKASIRMLPLEAAKEKLMKIKGIGNWTANYALMKTFRHSDAFPLEDAGLHNAIRVSLKLNRKPTLDEVRDVFMNYKGWEAYATLYLWRSL